MWATWPVFVQQTVPPVGMFTLCGSKKLSPMSTSVEPAGQVGGPPSTSFSTVSSEMFGTGVASRPPAAISVLPTAAPATNERCAISGGPADQLFPPGLNFTTSFVVNGVRNGVPPPIDHSSPPATAEPGTFLAIGMSARACQLSVAML